MKFLIVNFNTQKLVDALIRSINKFHDNVEIIIFDNSNRVPFKNIHENVFIMDNTKGQIVNFDKILEKCDLTQNTGNSFGSFKHCLTIDKCIDLIDDGFILLDSDILLKRNVSELENKGYGCVGEVVGKQGEWKDRILPFICYINSDLCKTNNIKYCSNTLMWGVKHNRPYYDTGSFFLDELRNKNIPIKNIRYVDYAVHYGAGSYRDYAERTGGYKHLTEDEWLKKYNNLYNT